MRAVLKTAEPLIPTSRSTLVLPVDFTKLIWAGLAGFIVFAEISDIWTVLGAVVVFGPVFCMAWRERRGPA